ncbi:MAG TPA: spondin domain-containing protein [Nitrospiria bacterium]|nr:spondin domain-containing protein [Nitrospiria bacterium]
MKRTIFALMGFLLAWSGAPGKNLSLAQSGDTYRVTITNLTPGQVITPPVVIVHSNDFSLFQAGHPASPELAALAEDGDTGPLATLLADDPRVFDFAVGGGVILPGESWSVEVSGSGNRHISAAAMLAVTNDAFIGLDSFRLSPGKTSTIDVPAYDAGSEFNSESCSYVPACGGGGVHDPAASEGFVHIHSGIHGIADLDPAIHDWRNPAAKTTIQKIQ